MGNQRKFVLSVVIVLLLASLAACMPGMVQVPTRQITISADEAVAAQRVGMAALATGKVEWTENQFSSFLTELLKQNMGHNTPIQAIHVWFEPNNEMYVRVLLKEGVLKQGNTLDLHGSVHVTNHHVVVRFQQAGVGDMSVSEPILTTVNSQIDKAFASASLGVAATVKTETGKLMIQLGG